MIAEKMKPFINKSSAIRAAFEEGLRLKGIYGEDQVFDFSLGNPNVPPPAEVKQAIIDILNEEDPTVVHGYMPNAGFEDVRRTVAESLNRRFGTAFTEGNILMTVGAACGLTVALRTLVNPGEEVVTFAPHFPEYRSYAAGCEAKLVTVSPDTATFQPNLQELEEKLTDKTRVVLINTPHNPTGVIYSEETIRRLAEILERKQKENGSPIFLLSDEPYRELAYDGAEVPYVTKYYANTIVCYSYSKSLSLPGERIGYLVIPDELEDSRVVFKAAVAALRTSGAVNAPSLMQRVIARCIDARTDLSYYDRNRNTLYEGVTKAGFSCIKPEGAFYLFVKSPTEDESAFCDLAKEYNLLLVPGSAFGCPGYVRLAYCVSYETIVNSLPRFEQLGKACFG